MKIGIEVDELYPVYTVADGDNSYCSYQIEVPDAKVLEWKAAQDAFVAAQSEIEAACKGGAK